MVVRLTEPHRLPVHVPVVGSAHGRIEDVLRIYRKFMQFFEDSHGRNHDSSLKYHEVLASRCAPMPHG